MSGQDWSGPFPASRWQLACKGGPLDGSTVVVDGVHQPLMHIDVGFRPPNEYVDPESGTEYVLGASGGVVEGHEKLQWYFWYQTREYKEPKPEGTRRYRLRRQTPEEEGLPPL